ncbi:hypothetical protein NEOCIP111885_03584 [Pseudoneobacillus rhizosphaerae]|uniref:Uncharacterized protein n=1 Tax=Pseudoneobacillus rhizosphaerae TaxID=2880968 RepID=A0A9C7LB71_9BACI|nr:hypothetical protein NEOCIP111885_03584 [Pseudoneobacillus rhizosphaerae]
MKSPCFSEKLYLKNQIHHFIGLFGYFMCGILQYMRGFPGFMCGYPKFMCGYPIFMCGYPRFMRVLPQSMRKFHKAITNKASKPNFSLQLIYLISKRSREFSLLPTHSYKIIKFIARAYLLNRIGSRPRSSQHFFHHCLHNSTILVILNFNNTI